MLETANKLSLSLITVTRIRTLPTVYKKNLLKNSSITKHCAMHKRFHFQGYLTARYRYTSKYRCLPLRVGMLRHFHLPASAAGSAGPVSMKKPKVSAIFQKESLKTMPNFEIVEKLFLFINFGHPFQLFRP